MRRQEQFRGLYIERLFCFPSQVSVKKSWRNLRYRQAGMQSVGRRCHVDSSYFLLLCRMFIDT
jgi:hypothetical protein